MKQPDEKFELDSSVTPLTDPVLLADENSFEFSMPSKSKLAQALPDPDPTTKVVSGSGRDASGKALAKSEQHRPAVLGREKRKREEGEGENPGRVRAVLQRYNRILEVCYDHGFVTSRVIERALLQEMDPRSVKRILQRLVQRQELFTHTRYPLDGKGVYQLTREAHKKVRERVAHDLAFCGTPNHRTFKHEYTLIETRIHLQRILGGHWLPDRALRTDQETEVPDGILSFNDGSRIAIEVELSIKKSKRLDILLSRWARSPIELVVYVTETQNVREYVEDHMKKFGRVDYLGTISLDELRRGSSKIWTPNGAYTLKPREAIR